MSVYRAWQSQWVKPSSLTSSAQHIFILPAPLHRPTCYNIHSNCLRTSIKHTGWTVSVNPLLVGHLLRYRMSHVHGCCVVDCCFPLLPSGQDSIHPGYNKQQHWWKINVSRLAVNDHTTSELGEHWRLLIIRSVLLSGNDSLKLGVFSFSTRCSSAPSL